MRFQHGVDDSPTRLPISATESEASCCSTPRIFRSMASMPKSLGKRDGLFLSGEVLRTIFFFYKPNCSYREQYSFSSAKSFETAMAFLSSFRFLRPLAIAAAMSLAFAAAARAENVAPLVSTGWLKQHLNDPEVFVLDIRSAIDGGGVEAYRKGHIPGAIHSDYDKAGWRVTRGGVPFMLPTLAELEKLIGELGIDEDTHVIVVPAGVHYTDFGSAARSYWTLQVAGVPNVSILDGGYAAWAAEENAIETGASKPSPKIFTASFNKALLAERTDVEKIEQ